jgi:hypothetical protein
MKAFRRNSNMYSLATFDMSALNTSHLIITNFNSGIPTKIEAVSRFNHHEYLIHLNWEDDRRFLKLEEFRVLKPINSKTDAPTAAT